MTTKQQSKLKPEWREFEELVARIEQALVSSSATVRSPDRLRSLVTNRLREVDASIRVRVGSAEVVITVECRKRRATQDVTWLEQLASKKQALGVARTIAVATSKFSESAVQVGRHYGIDLRLIRDITDEDIKCWIFPESVVHMYHRCECLGHPEIGLEMLPGETPDLFEREPLLTGIQVQDFVFLTPDNERLNLSDIFNRAAHRHDIYSKIPKDGTFVRMSITLDVRRNDLRIDTPAGPRAVRRIHLDVKLAWGREEIPLDRAKVVEYCAPNGISAPTIARAEFDTRDASKYNIRLGFQQERGQDGMSVSLQLLDKKREG